MKVGAFQNFLFATYGLPGGLESKRKPTARDQIPYDGPDMLYVRRSFRTPRYFRRSKK